jgi:hypothetical protein
MEETIPNPSAAVPGRTPLRGRRRIYLAICLLLLIAGMGGAQASPGRAVDAAGRRLSLSRSGPFMGSVNAPARIARVVIVPGSDGSEAWGLGYSYAHREGFDQITPVGQVVFLHFTSAAGWQVDGPPLGSDGKPVNPQLSTLDVASNGEGYAVGSQGVIFHHLPGRGWRLDPRSGVTKNTLYSVSIRRSGSRVYGYAVGTNLTFLRLDAHGWAVDVASGSVPAPSGNVPTLAGVTTVSAEEAWAVSGKNSNSLLIFHRSAGAWTRVTTGNPIFDSPPAPVTTGDGTGTVNQFSRGNAIAAGAGGVWITGMMQPVDATKPTGDNGGADRSRPFVLRMRGSTFTSWCPPQYQLSSSGVTRTVAICDRSLPYSTGDLPALATSGDEVFVGGLGLFRFAGNRWTREPSILGYIASATFATPTEGWVATPGDVVGGSGSMTASSTTLGHWTTRASAPDLARWPHADRQTLEAVALDPSGSGRAMAVGRAGSIVSLRPDIGWDRVASPVTETLHGLAWPARDEAWAVGNHGVVVRFDGRRWARDEGASALTDSRLYAIAFDGRDRGVAVGDKGTILRFDGTRWHRDPSPSDRKLSAVGVAGDDFIAVGNTGTILVERGERWRVVTEVADALKSGQEAEAPNLFSVACMADGSALIGGARSALIERTPSGRFVVGELPVIEGSILAIAARRDQSGTLHAVASVGSGSRFNGDGVGSGAGWLSELDERGWHDISHARAVGATPATDAPALRDAAYGIAMEPTGRGGWVVGGYPADVFDEDGHLRSTPTASVWRLDLAGAPSSAPAQLTASVPTVRGASFAFLGDTSCATGLCSQSLGAASGGDVVLQRALAEIEQLARAGRVGFVAFGGDMRHYGLPDELEPVRALLGELSVPAFAAIGDKDLASGPAVDSTGVLASNGYYLEAFRAQPLPWGEKPAPRGFRPVQLRSSPSAGAGARTHYAFDYAPSGEAVLRAIFLDTSRVPLAASTQTQNPPEEQTGWLQAVLADAQTKRLPSIVVMHQPVVLPVSTSSDASVVTGILTAGTASAVLASHVRTNQIVMSPSAAVPDAVPVGIFGGGGSPLSNGSDPLRGAYRSYQIVTIDDDPSVRTLTGRAPVTIQSIPILESVALHAVDGYAGHAGAPLRFTGLGRAPDMGGAHALGPNADQNQGRATYLALPFPTRCGLLSAAEGCTAADVAIPQFRFLSENPDVAEFVRADPSDPRKPFRDGSGRLVRDSQSGLLCTFKPGSTSIQLQSGSVASRIPMTVQGGSGPCTPAVFADIAGASPQPGSEPDQPAAVRADEVQPNLLRPRLPQTAAVAAIAPPIVNAAPAPPAGGGGQRQEEQQAASERADMTALRRPARTELPSGVPVVIAMGVLAFVAARIARTRHRPSVTPVTVFDRGRNDR